MDDCDCSLTASDSGESLHWSGVLGIEGQMTGDGRYIEHNALHWDDLPLPLRYVSSDVGAHDGAQVVGRITNVWRGENGKIMGEGDFDPDSEHGKEAARQVAKNLTNGVSMDLDDVSFEVRMSSELVSLMEAEGVAPDGEEMADEEGRVKVATVKSDDEVRITTSGRIRAATIVAIPAFAEAKIALAAGGIMQTFGYNPKQARAPKGTAKGGQWIDTPKALVDTARTAENRKERVNRVQAAAQRELRARERAGEDVRDFAGVVVGKKMKPTKQHRAVMGEDMLGTVWAMNPDGEVQHFDYDYEAALAFTGISKDSDVRIYRFPDTGYRGSYGTPLDPKPGEKIRPGQMVVFAKPSAQTASAFVEEESNGADDASDEPEDAVGENGRDLFAMGVALLKETDDYQFGSDEYIWLTEQALTVFQEAAQTLEVEGDSLAEDAVEIVDALDTFLAVDWSMWQPSDDEQPDLAEPGLDEAITASASSKAPPLAWFRDPGLPGPTPLTVTDDGRVYGHLASWGTCHIGHSHNGTCVTPPRSKTRYAHFRVGSVFTAEGKEVATGRITLETRHAKGTLNPTQTLAHYEDTGMVVADVAAGEDRHGIWIAGCIRPGTPDDKIAALRGSPLSGDWRRIGGNLELVAALAVNVPGFPIPRPAGLVASGRLQSLVASGMVAPKKVAAPGTPEALSTDDLRYLKRLAARERSNEAEAMRLRVKRADLAMRRKEFVLVGVEA